MTIQERIYEIIEAKMLKQSSVARAINYDVKVFNDMLKGRKRITSDDIVPICIGLGVTPNELIDMPKPVKESA